MKDSLKVASWEIRRNMRNKSFIISMLITPFIMLLFGALPTVLSMLESSRPFTVYVADEIGIYDTIQQRISEDQIELILHDGKKEDLPDLIREKDHAGYIVFDQDMVEHFIISLVTASDGLPNVEPLRIALINELHMMRRVDLGLSEDEVAFLSVPPQFVTVSLDDETDDWAKRVVPAVFAGFILIAVSISGMMTLYSSIAEKKDKMAEILLSSVSAASLMQGKIFGYFVLGLIQTFVWIAVAIPVAYIYFEIPVLQFLIVPELPLMLIYALLGYLLYSALFVSMGATIDDISEAGNFHSIIFILPWLPLFFIGAIIANPSGIVAKIGTYFPFTIPGVMLFRLAFVSRIPVTDVVLSLLLLIFVTWLVIRLGLTKY